MKSINAGLFTGDAVFGGGAVGWANARWLSNYTDHAESLQRLIAARLSAKTFFAAHGLGLPYSSHVPEACLETLHRLIKTEADPCNHTPQCKRRSADETQRKLEL